MNGKKITKKRSDISKIYGMMLLLFISIVGYIMSNGNPVCYIGMAYASTKTIMVSWKHVVKIIKGMNRLFSFKMKIVVGLLILCLLSISIGIYMIMHIQSDYTEIIKPDSIHPDWGQRNIIIIQNHPVIFMTIAIIILSLFLIMTINKYLKEDCIILQYTIEKNVKKVVYGIIQNIKT